MLSRGQIIAIAAAIIAILLYSSIFVVRAGYQAVVLRFGEIVQVQKEPGLYFKLPFGMFDMDTVTTLEERILRFDLDNIRLQVSGGKFYDVDAFVAYRIADAALFMSRVSGSRDQAEQRVKTRLDAALRLVYGLRGFEAALSEERGSMMREVRDQIGTAARELGLEITDVRIRKTELTADVSQQTYDRMKAERLAEAERLRARGTERAQGIRAKANREATELQAAAQRDGNIVRGQGEAERNAIFSDAFSRDPEFFEFDRSLKAYEQSLTGTGTTMILSPDSEFFRYFNKAGDAAPTQGRTPGVQSSATPAPAAPAPAAPAPAAPAPVAPAPAQ